MLKWYFCALFGLAGALVNAFSAPEFESRETFRAAAFSVLAVFFFLKARASKAAP